jgi:oxygen-dependent protoporphyrinogen oxidase
MKRIVIIGGGITGLAAAYRLKKKSPDTSIQVLEACSRPGGVLHTLRRDGYQMEGGPDCFLSDNPRVLELCRELGLSDELINTRTDHRRSFIVRGGQLHPIPEGFYLIAPSKLRPFLASPILSWRGKWRVLAEALLPGRPQTDESLASFVRRRLGQEALDWLAQPLLAGIYAADPETLSLQATFPQFLTMESNGGVLVGLAKQGSATRNASGARYSLFVSLRSGMQTLTDRLAKELSRETLRVGCPVQTIQKRQGAWLIHFSNGGTLEADAVCLALPATHCARLLNDVDSELSGLLTSIPYSGSATIHYAYPEEAIRHPLDGSGFVMPHAEKRTVLACTFVHRKFDARVPAGYALLRAFVGGALQTDLLQLEDDELDRRVREDLETLLGIDQPPIFSQINRYPEAMPQYTLGHVRRALQFEESVLGLPGLALAGNWLHGVGIPDCIESGERAADRLVQFLQRSENLSLR